MQQPLTTLSLAFIASWASHRCTQTVPVSTQAFIEAFLYLLMTYDLKGYNVRNVPKTEALKEQKLLSLSPEEEWWYQKLLQGHVLDKEDKWNNLVIKEEVVSDFVENARKFNITRRGSATSLGRFLKKMCPTLDQVQKEAEIEVMSAQGFSYVEKRRVYHFVFPTLGACRERWVELFGKEDWQSSRVLEQTEAPF
jgi:hypothetical protein